MAASGMSEESAQRYAVAAWRLLNGPRRLFDEERVKALAREEFRRARSLPSMFNHALLKGGEELYGKVRTLRLPVLVIHGTEARDPQKRLGCADFEYSVSYGVPLTGRRTL